MYTDTNTHRAKKNMPIRLKIVLGKENTPVTGTNNSLVSCRDDCCHSPRSGLSHFGSCTVHRIQDTGHTDRQTHTRYSVTIKIIDHFYTHIVLFSGLHILTALYILTFSMLSEKNIPKVTCSRK